MYMYINELSMKLFMRVHLAIKRNKNIETCILIMEIRKNLINSDKTYTKTLSRFSSNRPAVVFILLIQAAKIDNKSNDIHGAQSENRC